MERRASVAIPVAKRKEAKSVARRMDGEQAELHIFVEKTFGILQKRRLRLHTIKFRRKFFVRA